MLHSSQRDNARSNEPCACKKDIPDGCLHSDWDVFFCKHTANAATKRDAKHSESVGMADVSGGCLLLIIVFSCGETQKILYRKAPWGRG